MKSAAKNGAGLNKMLSLIKSAPKIKYDVITIMGGGNDSGSKDAPTDKYAPIYKEAKDRKPKLIVAMTNPTKINHPKQKTRYPSNEKLAQHVRDNYSTLGADMLIDVNKIFSEDKYFKDDKVHLHMSQGFPKLRDLWIQEVLPKIPKSLSEKKKDFK